MEERIEQEVQTVCGRNAVFELLKSDIQTDTVYISSTLPEKEFAHIISIATAKGAVIKKVPANKLDKLSAGEKHQGVVAVCPGIQYSTLDDVFAIAKERGEAPFLILADGIEDPHNLGAIIRTAECAGAHGVIFPKRGGCGITSTVFRTSAGACAHLPLVRVSNLASAIREIKDRGVFCYCADMDGAYCGTADLTGACALIVGAEGNGVSRLVKDLCDMTISLPLRGHVNSLNASVAAGAVIYEIVRQRLMLEKKQ